MEYKELKNSDIKVSRIALGSWAIGGWLWGGTDENQSIKTVIRALEKGVNTIDTAPAYGFGKSEEIIGKALKEYGNRNEIIIATKAGIEWRAERVYRNSSKVRIEKEIDDSLRRLKVDHIDIYQIHWPDPNTPFEETAGVMSQLQKKGKIRAIGVSNFSPEQMASFNSKVTLNVCQPPYNLFEREIENDVIPFCKERGITILSYGALCRGLLSGKMHRERTFTKKEIRGRDPKFKQPVYDEYLSAVSALQDFARENYNKDVLHFAVRWILDKGIDAAIWGARNTDQVSFDKAFGWKLRSEDFEKIDALINKHVKNPVGPEFMAPPPFINS